MRKLTSLLLTGGAGFIGSALVRQLLRDPEVEHLTVLDKLTYAGRRENLAGPDQDPRLHFIEGDICDHALVEKIMTQHRITGIFHLAAESHVDNSIKDSTAFLHTNVLGTSTLLDAAKKHEIPLLHCSTDEVYGSIETPDAFTEESPLNPSSPYSASKASADLLCLAHHTTFGSDVVITRCSNNYGPRQHPEKLIPQLILRALRNEPLPLYGDGMNIRDWIHVDDHCDALITVYKKANPGHIFNFGGHCERTNIGLARSVLKILDKPESLIEKVPDRLGHDRRYAIDTTKALTYFGWKPQKRFNDTFPNLVREICAHHQELL